MCGIAGIYNLNSEPVSQELLKKMCDIIRYRGPDDEGYYVDNNIGFGHRRLSIIDLVTGHQPMSNEDETIWITYNGEIYNYIELMETLQKRGHVFRTKSDTEVILHAYEEYGDKCVDYLNGMFAFAIWDKRKQELFCARDRLGIKPFYYYYDGKRFVFASEIKAILQVPSIDVIPDNRSILDYLTFQYVIGEGTLFSGIRKLLPGYCLTVSAEGLRVKQYWNLKFISDYEHDENWFVERLSELVEDAVRIQLRSDVPLGCHLSGGIDSSTVTCLAAKLSNQTIKTFSGKFADGEAYDESKYARLVSKHANTDHYEIVPTASDFIETLSKLIWYMDEPAAGPGIFPQYYVSKLSSENVKVVLGGQGGDEVFVGYGRYMQAYLKQTFDQRLFHKTGYSQHDKVDISALNALSKFYQAFGVRALVAHFLKRSMLPPDRHYFHLIGQSWSENGLLSNDFLSNLDGYSCFDSFMAAFHQQEADSLIARMQGYDITNYLAALLHVEDRVSMAVSLESRVPLLDHRIVEFAATIPIRIKFQDAVYKSAFKKAVQNIIPQEVLARTDKKGFPVPLDIWFNGCLRKVIQEILIDSKTSRRGIFQSGVLQNLINSKSYSSSTLWPILCLELWFRNFIDSTL